MSGKRSERAVLNPVFHSIGVSSKSAVKKSKISRVSSFYSKEYLDEDVRCRSEVAERLLTVFRRFEDDIVQHYFYSRDFAQDFLCLCEYAKLALKEDPSLFHLKGPVHVFGDIHGNIDDLFFFRDKLWPAGMDLTAGKFLFLGDYVDRGMRGLEVLTYLFSQKVCAPNKIYLLRGNHELRYVNGWEAHYRERSFLWQCKDRFGQKLGERVWEAANEVFDYLPLACTIDDSIFCSHGGIPRQRLATQDTRMEDLVSFPRPAKISPSLPEMEGHEDDADSNKKHKTEELSPWQSMLAMDCLWGDPCPSNSMDDDDACLGDDLEQESDALDEKGFGPGQRGGAAIMFGQRAVDEFFESFGFSLMLRAHQANAAGVSVTKNGKVVTVFSTSKDHAIQRPSCAYLLVEDLKVTAVNRVVDEPTWTHTSYVAAPPKKVASATKKKATIAYPTINNKAQAA